MQVDNRPDATMKMNIRDILKVAPGLMKAIGDKVQPR